MSFLGTHRARKGGWVRLAGCVVLAVQTCACTGIVSGAGSGSESQPSTPLGVPTGTGSSSPAVGEKPSTLPPGTATNPAAVPPSMPAAEAPRRLSSTEYRNTVRDLLLDTTSTIDANDLPVDEIAGTSGFLSGAGITSAPDVRLLLGKADQITTAAMPRLANAVPCIATSGAGDDCARQFITTFGRRAYRRPLADEEQTRLFALYSLQRDPAIGAGFSEALRAVVMAMLQSPSFLYRWELGPREPIRDGSLVRFNAHEMASRLSYALWASMPDDRLFQLADSDQLSTVSQLQQEARRMIADPKAKGTYSDFATQWLSLTQLPFSLKDPGLNFTPAVAQSMLAETGAFVSSLFLDPAANGSFEALLTSRSSFIDGTLAKIYGIPSITGAALQPVTFDAKQRSGILTQLSFQTRHGDTGGSFPVRRGAQVYRRLFCREVELPLDVAVVPPPPATPGQTTRQRFTEHSKNPCAFCHKLCEPIGFGFENYDGIGAYRTTDNGQPVDATGTVTVDAEEVTFSNAIDLAQALAKSDQVRDCFATQWMRFALRRRETDGDLASVAGVQKAFRESSFDMRELLVAITASDAFSHRSPSEGEPLP